MLALVAGITESTSFSVHRAVMITATPSHGPRLIYYDTWQLGLCEKAKSSTESTLILRVRICLVQLFQYWSHTAVRYETNMALNEERHSKQRIQQQIHNVNISIITITIDMIVIICISMFVIAFV